MTTARDVIAKAIDKVFTNYGLHIDWRLRDTIVGTILADLPTAPDSVRQELTALLMPTQGKEILSHTRSCPALTPGDGPCTCALVERQALQTCETMNAAWRKRTEEAEAALLNLWRPIETAPRTGAPIILLWGGNAMEGYYLNNSATRVPWQGWKLTDNRVPWPKGNPTHWLPFPALASDLTCEWPQ